MPRTPTIRYFPSRKAYYTQSRGKQHLLAGGERDDPDGPVYKAAVERFNQVVQAGGAGCAGRDCLVSVVIFRYLDSLEQDGRLESLRLARTLLDPAAAAFGHVAARELRPFVVTGWLNEMAKPPASTGRKAGRWRAWSRTTQGTAVDTLLGAFAWATRQGIIAGNPIAGLPRPEKRSRGVEVVPPEEVQDAVIAAANPELAKLLRVLRSTGARPGEIMYAECRHYRPAISAIVHPWNVREGEFRWKCSRTKRDRVIYLDDELKALVEAEVKKRGGKGRIFRTLRGRPWKGINLRNRIAALAAHPGVLKCCKRHGFDPSKLMAYSFRHAYITRVMSRGAPIKLVADACGTSVRQIEKTYSHAHDDHAAMRALLLRFSCGRTSG